jgi:hypothetical protein
MLVLLPLAVLLFLTIPRIRAAVGPISPQRQMLLSLVLFLIMCAAAVAEAVTEGRLRFYETIVLAGMAFVGAVTK